MSSTRSLDIRTVSVVIPVYRNAPTLPILVEELSMILSPLQIGYQLIFVVDACPDESLNVLKQLSMKAKNIEIIELIRNCGQNWSVLIGMTYADGDAIVTLDADLQDPPRAIPDLLHSLSKGADAVFAGRRGHYESNFRLFSSKLFKKLLSCLSAGRIPADAGLFLAISKPMVDRMLQLRIRNPYIISLIGLTEGEIRAVTVVRNPSVTGSSSYSFVKRLCVAWSALRTLHVGRIQRGKTILMQVQEDFKNILILHNSSKSQSTSA